MKDIGRKLRVQRDLFLVGTVDGRLVATVMAGYEGHRGWINYLAVAKECRGRGFVRRLMAEAEARVLAIGCPKDQPADQALECQSRRILSAHSVYKRAAQKPVISLGAVRADLRCTEAH